jgi:hypothetical protein
VSKPPISKAVERRTEPRFSISSPVKVTLLSSLDRQVDGRMVDLSATGMRFIANEIIPLDEIVAVDFEDHLAVAAVRNCQRYGDKFSIGTSRIHSLPKDQLPAGKPQYEQIRALLEAKGWSIEFDTEDHLGDLVGAPVPTSQADAAPEHEVSAPIEEADQSEHVTRAEDLTPAEEVATAEEVAKVEQVITTEEVTKAEEVIKVDEPASDVDAVATPVEAASVMSAPTPVKDIAVVEGVAPAKTVAAAPRASFIAPKAQRSPLPPQPVVQRAPHSRRVMMAAAILVILLASAILVLRFRHQAPTHDTVVAAATSEALPTPPVVEASAVDAPALAAPIPVSVAVAVAKPTEAPSSSNSHTVHLTTLNPSWISATADGKAIIAKMLRKGDDNEFQFSRIAFVHLGNGSAVEISLDGKPFHPAGGDAGPLRLVEITPDGARTLPWTNGDPHTPLAK